MRLRPSSVLAYHGIGAFPRTLDPHNLMVTEERFTQQVRHLRRRGYEFVTVDRFVAEQLNEQRDRRVCALTFDDGSIDNANVLPRLLESLDLVATVYVCPGLFDAPHPFMDPGAAVRLLSRGELLALNENPRLQIGAHTLTHADLTDASEEQAFAEMRACRIELEEILGRPVKSFAYPFCTYSPECPCAAARAGYESAVTCGGRGGLRPYELQRTSIDSLDGRLSFAVKCTGRYYGWSESVAGRGARRLLRRFRHPAALTP